jgi:seryl-tRNA synthetase
VAFPDTVVDMNNSSGNRNKIKALSEEESYTIIGDVQTINKTHREGKVKEESVKPNQSLKKATESINQEMVEAEKNKQSTSKRGQKGKMKKMKEKYKDQDEDERQLKMDLLQVFLCFCEEVGKNTL